MWKVLYAVLCWVLAVHGRKRFDEFDTLGEQISARVAADLRPLEGLGSRISARVGHNMEQMQMELHTNLDGLGDKISQQVHQGLEPVRAIELNLKIKNGVGGTTIVTHRPSGRQFLIKNHRVFSCSGRINENTGDCSGSLTPFEITESSPRSDWCFSQSYSLVNNQLCLSVGALSVTSYNGHLSCSSSNNEPILVTTLDEYKRMCSSIAESAEYIYIPNESDPDHVAIPNENRYVSCENRQRNYCVFKERNALMNTFGHGGILVINNGISVISS